MYTNDLRGGRGGIGQWRSYYEVNNLTSYVIQVLYEFNGATLEEEEEAWDASGDGGATMGKGVYDVIDNSAAAHRIDSKMNWPLVLTCFLLPQSCILGASRGCTFPEEWYGRWFQSGITDLVTVNGSEITSKGFCIEKNGDKFLVHDTKYRCYRCIVMHAQHANVLQYKETYCTSDSPEPSLLTQCGTLTSDATLVSLFRSNAAPLPCPIKGPLEFTYSQGEGECNSPRSRAEACTQDSRLLLRYQACANVHSSESVDVELECLAHWREGSTNYMVARLHSDRNDRKTSDEESYRCFIYTNPSNNTWNLAQSSDAACNGLISVTEAARTFKMTQKKPPQRCAYPSWVVAGKSWVALDRMASRLLASPYNLTILDETRLALFVIRLLPLMIIAITIRRQSIERIRSNSSQRQHGIVESQIKEKKMCMQRISIPSMK
ncbi:PREDICTED: LOW QUALITY PROTEIN: uncharacterized protein LOC105145981 [Acromyrmex echinatior]|uniref:LOW QUALITY PROTEIN: uncharacterized protein LOC105145981 n=1 Tax=Acromyrmex echinatior TaxID=103372 RepID=UPI000580F83C|nr:PREDICTED: LOW QUALITY PROTEIN: uncharacterized protein LOC105145981 [Acromyrmex echinatior]